MNEDIIVVLHPQPILDSKYCGMDGQPCYLADALHAAGHKNVHVGGWGKTFINDVTYQPLEPFGYDILANAFRKNQSIIVTLRPQHLLQKGYNVSTPELVDETAVEIVEHIDKVMDELPLSCLI